MMNFETEEDIEYLLYSIDGEYSLNNKDIAFECVKKAVALNNKYLEFRARYEHLSQLVFCNLYEEAIPMYPWLLNYMKTYDEEHMQILWAFKWIVGHISHFHKIPLSKINELFELYEKEYTAYGETKKIVAYKKLYHYLNIGELSLADEMYDIFKKSKKGELDDCGACQKHGIIEYHFAKKNYKALLAESEKLFSQKQNCVEVPNITYPLVCYVYLLLNKLPEAEHHAQIANKKLKFNIFQSNAFFLLLYYSKTKQFVQGKKLIDKQLPFIVNNNDNIFKFNFYSACYVYFKCLEQDNITDYKLKSADLVKGKIQPTKANNYAVTALKDYFYNEAKLESILLDNRNQNKYYDEKLGELVS